MFLGALLGLFKGRCQGGYYLEDIRVYYENYFMFFGHPLVSAPLNAIMYSGQCKV